MCRRQLSNARRRDESRRVPWDPGSPDPGSSPSMNDPWTEQADPWDQLSDFSPSIDIVKACRDPRRRSACAPHTARRSDSLVVTGLPQGTYLQDLKWTVQDPVSEFPLESEPLDVGLIRTNSYSESLHG